MSLVRNLSRPRDSSSFTLYRVLTKTNFIPIEGKRTIVGAEKAQRELAMAMTSRTKVEIEEGWEWRLEPHSNVARRRKDFGFQPGMN